MIAIATTLEDRLLHGYRAQVDHYDRAAEILEAARDYHGSADDDWAHDLHAHLLEAAALEAAMAQDIAAWRESGQSPGGQLQAFLQVLARRIKTLSADVDRLVGEMQTRQLGLAAEIDEFIQNRRMLQAYVKQS